MLFVCGVLHSYIYQVLVGEFVFGELHCRLTLVHYLFSTSLCASDQLLQAHIFKTGLSLYFSLSLIGFGLGLAELSIILFTNFGVVIACVLVQRTKINSPYSFFSCFKRTYRYKGN